MVGVAITPDSRRGRVEQHAIITTISERWPVVCIVQVAFVKH